MLAIDSGKLSGSDKLFSLGVGLFVGVFVVLFRPLYSVGDGEAYANFYDKVMEVDFWSVLPLQVYALSSAEPLHGILSWAFSSFLQHEFYVALISALFAMTLARSLTYIGYGKLFSTTFLFTNFYLLTLYVPGERLKLAFLIFLIGFNCFFAGRPRLGSLICFLALLAHVQISLFLLSAFAFLSWGVASQIIRERRVNKSVLGGLAIFSGIIFYMSDYMFAKIGHYLEASLTTSLVDITDLLKPTAFLLLSLFSGFDRRGVFAAFLPLIVASAIVSSDRVTMVAFFLFLFFASRRTNILTLILPILCVYYGIKTLDFLKP